jgi:hypothetical protein
MEGAEPTHSFGCQILSLARLPIPPHRDLPGQVIRSEDTNTCPSPPFAKRL